MDVTWDKCSGAPGKCYSQRPKPCSVMRMMAVALSRMTFYWCSEQRCDVPE